MKKTTVLLIGGILLLVLIGFIYVSRSGSVKKTTSIKALHLDPVTQRCTFTDEKNNSSGTIFTTNKLLKGNFIVSTDEVTIYSHMIIQNDTVYVWLEGQTEGFTYPLNRALTSPVQLQNNLNIEEEHVFTCTSPSIDKQTFAMPQGVTFNELNSRTQQRTIKTFELPGDDPACIACNTAPIESRAGCKAALGCK